MNWINILKEYKKYEIILVFQVFHTVNRGATSFKIELEAPFFVKRDRNDDKANK